MTLKIISCLCLLIGINRRWHSAGHVWRPSEPGLCGGEAGSLQLPRDPGAGLPSLWHQAGGPGVWGALHQPTQVSSIPSIEPWM